VGYTISIDIYVNEEWRNKMNISKDVLEAFNLKGNIEPLSGGQNTSVKINDVVLKPVDNDSYCEWVSNVISKIDPQGYRISKPIKSKLGTFIYEGWCCTRYEPGENAEGNVSSKLKAARLFHSDLAKVDFSNRPKSNDPWSKAHEVAWQREQLPKEICKQAIETIGVLLEKVKLQNSYNVQIVHSDLSGNILFDEKFGPLIIDFSPTIAPVEYAEAILVCDCIAWQGSPITDIDLLPDSEFYREMILRATIFRLTVAAIFAGNDSNKFVSEYDSFKGIINYISQI
jgi:uncharacterized protein (TIGR02569 family)